MFELFQPFLRALIRVTWERTANAPLPAEDSPVYQRLLRLFEERFAELERSFRSDMLRLLVDAVRSGESVEDVAFEIARVRNVGLVRAETIAHTELAAGQSVVKVTNYAQLGVDRYEYLAKLDERTTQLCKDANGKVFSLRDATLGTNLPPLHPRCRSTVIPYVGE
jgi:SPP1 gp7 family putative phage head morphogenesis protein